MSHPDSRPPLRILIAADTFTPHINGAARFGHRLAAGLAKRGHEVHVVAPTMSRGKSYSEAMDGFQVHRLRSHAVPTHPFIRVCLPWEITGEVGRLLEKIKPDVVHVQCHYMVGRAVVDATVKRGIRLIATNHVMPENLDPFLPFPQWFLRIIARNSWKDMGKVLGKAETVTTPTPLGAKAMHDHAFLSTVLPVSNGIDATAYELQPDETAPVPERPTLLFAGRLAQEKNIEVLIEALAKIPAELDAQLEIVGGGEVRESLEATAAACGMADRVNFLGMISDEDLRLAYLRCTVFCMPGTAELQSLVTLEAMSASKPVVLADAMALPHLVHNGENGYLFTPGDSTELAVKLTSILALPQEQRDAMGAASRAMVQDHSMEATLDTFEALYRGDHPDRLAVKPGNA